MKIGKYTLYNIESGSFALDGGAMFGIIPKVLWEKQNPADEKNRIRLVTRNLLLVSDTRKILIDTGNGDKWDSKAKNIYDFDQQSNSLMGELARLNLQASDITDVLLTHLHFDHTGGSTISNNGSIEPAFPNATYYVQKSNLEWAYNPTERDRGSYLKDNFDPLAQAGVLKVIDDSVNLLDTEIEIVRVNGHTRGQQLFKISDSSKTLLFCGDLLPTSSHIPLTHIMGYDLQPLISLQEKKYILDKAVEEDWLLFLEHDPHACCVTVKFGEKGAIVSEQFSEFPEA